MWTVMRFAGQVSLLKQGRHLVLAERFAGADGRVTCHQAHGIV